MSKSKTIIIVLIIIVVVALLGYLFMKGRENHSKVSALSFPSNLPWLNVKHPLTLSDLKGKVVVLDFWTYGCINCIHVIPDLKRLIKKYGNKIAIIGVHSPKFDNEKNIDTLRNIVKRYGLTYPIAQDVNHQLWNAYGVRGWPTQIVIDPKGKVVGQVVGEGHYELLNQTIAKLLQKYHKEINNNPLPLALLMEIPTKSFLAAPGKVTANNQWVAISDTMHNRIIITDHQRKINAIIGGLEAGLIDGSYKLARFKDPQGLVFIDDKLYVADTSNNAIRVIDLKSKTVKTLAANDKVNLFQMIPIRSRAMNSPWGLAYKKPYLYIAMAGNHQLWRIDLEKNKFYHYAGSGYEGIVDGTLSASQFAQPSGLSIAGDWLFVADSEDSAIRKINLKTGIVRTLIGQGLFVFGDKDGDFNQALLQHVLGVAARDVDHAYITDTYNHKLKLLEIEKRNILTLAGTGKPSRGEGEGIKSGLNEPGGLTLFGEDILIADTNNNRIMLYKSGDQKLLPWTLINTNNEKQNER